jgi:hypothetical protein
MRLVTFNEGRVGRVVDDRVVELDCASMAAVLRARR